MVDVTKEQKEWMIEKGYIKADANDYEVYRVFELHRNEWWNRDKDEGKSDKSREITEQQLNEAENELNAQTNVLTLDQIEKDLTYQDELLKATDRAKDFADIHKKGISIIEEFVNGKLELETQAYEKMENYIDTFVGDYKSDKMVKLHKEAHEKLKKLEEQNKGKETSETMDAVLQNKEKDAKDDAQTAEAEDIEVVVSEDNNEEKTVENETTDAKNTKDDTKTDEVDDNQDENVTDEDTEELELIRQERLRSDNSDTNEEKLDKIRLETMYKLGHISKEIYDQGIKDPKKAIETINSKMPLKESQMAEFEMKFAEIVINNNHLDMLPPSTLAKVYEQLKGISDPTVQQRLMAVASRIDSLITQAATKEGLYFGDITNIADTYDGYMAMMEARQKDINPNSDVAKNIAVVKGFLEKDIKEYDSLMNLDRNDLDATELYERFDKIEGGMKEVELRPEDLQILSSVKFTNDKGDPIPQFVDKDGKDVLDYSEGCKVKEDSQLDTIVKLAKSQVLQEELGSTVDVKDVCTPQRLQEQVSSILFAASVVSKTQKGIGENLDEFTKDGKLDKEKLHGFAKQISQEGGMSIDPQVYEKTLDNMVDATGGYASRLASKVGNDKSVVMKVLDSVKDIDKRADGRTTSTVTKRKARIEMLKRTVLTGVSAFAISGAITVAGAAGDAGLTALTGGTNKIAGVALGVGFGLTMCAIQIRKWRKQKKAMGESCGLRAMIKDRRLGPTLLTTALGSAALGFAVTGNPGVAVGLGYSAMAVGSISGAINTGIDANQMGLSKLEATMWGVVQAGAALGGGFGGRAAGNAFVDYINARFPNNEIFQHKETVTESYTESRTVTDVAKINADSDSFLRRTWFENNPEQLDALIKEHGSAEAVQYKIGAGAIEVPPNRFNNDPTILTQSWAQQNNLDPNIIDIVKNYPANSPEFQNAMTQLRPHFEHGQNYVSTIDNAPLRKDLYSHRSPESTYSAQGEVPTKTITETKTFTSDNYVPNKVPFGLGMVGVLGKIFPKKLKERAGSFLDKVKNIFGRKPKPDPIITELLEEYKIVYGVDLYDHKTKKFNSPETEARYKEYYGLVAEELKAETGARKDLEIKEYLKLRKQDLDKVICYSEGKDTIDPIDNDQRNYLKDIEKRGNEARVWNTTVKSTRETWQKSNLSKENKRKLTLSHFSKCLKHVQAKDDSQADGSKDPDLNIEFKSDSKGIVVVSMDKLLFGKDGEVVSKKINFNGNETVLEKELAVRMTLDELNGIKHNPKTNEVARRVKGVKKNQVDDLRGVPTKSSTTKGKEDESAPKDKPQITVSEGATQGDKEKSENETPDKNETSDKKGHKKHTPLNDAVRRKIAKNRSRLAGF